MESIADRAVFASEEAPRDSPLATAHVPRRWHSTSTNYRCRCHPDNANANSFSVGQSSFRSLVKYRERSSKELTIAKVFRELENNFLRVKLADGFAQNLPNLLVV